MNIRESFERILIEYPNARLENFAQHPLSIFFTQEIPNLIRQHIDEPERLIVKGSVGNGNWARSPWIALFDILITDSATDGYYPVFLFREDFSGFYLSLNQGITAIKEKYRTDAKKVLALKAADFRAQIRGVPNDFPEEKIDLKASSSANYSSSYEAGNAFAKFYSIDALPSEDELISDIKKILYWYEILSYSETVPLGSGEIEDDENSRYVEDLRSFRQHKRIERNTRLSKAAKRAHGFECQVCEMNFQEIYGELGKEYIEAHHLTPVSQLKGKKLLLDPKKDFAVLCSNCHRMIHRSNFADDIDRFRQEHYHK